MPEGDTVFLAATRLHAALAGAVLTKSDLRVPQHATVDLSGRRILEVIPRGKHLLFRIEGGTTLHTHYKMEGAWHLYRHGEKWRGPTFQVRAVLETEDFVAVGFQLAVVEVLDTAAEDEVVGHLGPDPLGDDWDVEVVVGAMRQRSDAEIATVLLDQRILAGLGNVYKSELCFLAGLHPWTKVGEVADLHKVAYLAERSMKANRKTGNQITTGDLRPGRQRWVYGRAGKRCFRCGTEILKADQEGYGGDRVTFWCPVCQPAISREEPAQVDGAGKEG
ncbi:MAG: Fpg/Nei family DNA glycosylase [Actinomycetota bacterium]